MTGLRRKLGICVLFFYITTVTAYAEPLTKSFDAMTYEELKAIDISTVPKEQRNTFRKQLKKAKREFTKKTTAAKSLK